jgi:hypothetical protein
MFQAANINQKHGGRVAAGVDNEKLVSARGSLEESDAARRILNQSEECSESVNTVLESQ